MIDCPRCGRENQDDARFCVGCGENLASVSKKQREKKDTYLGQVLDGKYLILEHLGDGGMGKVYKAEQLSLNKIVAVKILLKSLLQNETQVKRFQREAWSASRLDHPHSIGIIDFGTTEDESQFIVMEYLEGRELTDVITEDFPLQPDRIVKILGQVLSVLHEAHQNKIIHRDLKPDNIMLIQRAEEEDYVKVLDFGIAKLQERDPNQPALTMQGIVCGTPEYMSPEQAMGKELDVRTDIYSAGCILYEMLTRHVPFEANNYQAILGMHIRETPRRPSEAWPNCEIPLKLEEVALIAMQKERDLRFPDALAMKRALELALHEPDPEMMQPPVRAVNQGGKTMLMGADTAEKAGYGPTQVDPPEVAAEAVEMPPPSPIVHTTLEQMSASKEPAATTPPKATPKPTPKATPVSIPTEDFAVPGSGKGKMIAVTLVLLIATVAGLYMIFGMKPESEEPAQLADAKPEKQVEAKETGLVTKTAEELAAEAEKQEQQKEIEAKTETSPSGKDKADAETIAAKTEDKPEKKQRTDRKKRLTAIEKQKLSMEYYERGNKAFGAGNVESAIRNYSLAKKYNPKSSRVYKKLGMAYLKQGDKRKARNNFKKYLDLSPKAKDAQRIRELYQSL